MRAGFDAVSAHPHREIRNERVHGLAGTMGNDNLPSVLSRFPYRLKRFKNGSYLIRFYDNRVRQSLFPNFRIVSALVVVRSSPTISTVSPAIASLPKSFKIFFEKRIFNAPQFEFSTSVL